MKAKTPLPKARATKKGSAKPHIRMRKLKAVPTGAFPQSPLAFPSDPSSMASPAQAMQAPAGGMPPSASPGAMGE